MVTMTYDARNDLTHETADLIAAVAIPKEMLDLYKLNDVLTQYLQGYGVQFEEDEDDL